MTDYGSSWRIMRPSSVTDQIFIKANRIRSLETKKEAMVDEGTRGEWIAIVNYGIIGIDSVVARLRRATRPDRKRNVGFV